MSAQLPYTVKSFNRGGQDYIIVEYVATSKDAVRGTLRVNMDPFIAQLMLGPQLSRFLKRFPRLKLELIARDRLGDLVADGFDLAIRFGEPRPSTLVAGKLLDTRVVTVASPAYLKKAGRPIHPSELEQGNHRLIDFRDPQTGRLRMGFPAGP